MMVLDASALIAFTTLEALRLWFQPVSRDHAQPVGHGQQLA
jgi:hypothetical protein